MTAVLSEAEAVMEQSDELDRMFDEVHVPEGYKADIVEGAVHMSPQRSVHWQIILRVLRQLDKHFEEGRLIESDVRIDFPGYLNAFCPDLILIRAGAEQDDKGRWSPDDLEFVLEVISRGTAVNDYGPKKATYATAGVPLYLIADPYTGKCHLHSRPDGDEYRGTMTHDFGDKIDLAPNGLDLALETDGFPRD